jgi:hypothetical protein
METDRVALTYAWQSVNDTSCILVVRDIQLVVVRSTATTYGLISKLKISSFSTM